MPQVLSFKFVAHCYLAVLPLEPLMLVMLPREKGK